MYQIELGSIPYASYDREEQLFTLVLLHPFKQCPSSAGTLSALTWNNGVNLKVGENLPETVDHYCVSNRDKRIPTR